MDNFGRWAEENSAPGAVNTSLWNLLELHTKQFGTVALRGVSTDTNPREQISAFLSSMNVTFGAPEIAQHSWLDFATNPFPDLFGGPPQGVSVKVKDAMLKRRLTPAQIATAYSHLTRSDVDMMGGLLGLASYGGAVNAIATDATASAQRSTIIDMAINAGWIDEKDSEHNLTWTRAFYRDLFGDTGGVPVPNERYDGSFINHPDADHADAALNTSGVPWQALYYQANYPRLQRVKAQWDPRNVFHHALSITA